MKWFYLCVIQFKLYAIIPIIITADAIINNLFDGFFSRGIWSSIGFLISSVSGVIKINSEKKARKLNPNYFLVTPWGFIKEFVKRESSWLKKGGRFIIPFPKFKLIKWKNKKKEI